MTIPHSVRIGALVLATTAFYGYVGQMVPQSEVHPPAEVAMRADLTTADMVTVGREIMEGKGLCMTCHTIGKTGALRFPDLDGIGSRAQSRVPGLSDVDYLAESMYEPNAFVVPGFNPGMPAINKPPIGLTDQEILAVIAYLQTLGGTPTVTLQSTHRYLSGAPGVAPAPAAPKTGTMLKPAVSPPALVAAHRTATELGGTTRLADQLPLKLRRSAGASAKAEARQGGGGE
jgi:mono/diheme cytochrome c family protein